MKKTKRLFVKCFVIIVCMACLYGCTNNNTGKDLLVKNMFCDYKCECEYILKSADYTAFGECTVSHGDKNKIEFLSPDVFMGISAETDASGKSDVISMSYDRISSEIPKSIITRIDEMLLIFSDEVTDKIDALPQKDVIPYSEGNEESDALYALEVNCDAGVYKFIYNKNTGVLKSIFAKYDDAEFTVNIISFQPEI